MRRPGASGAPTASTSTRWWVTSTATSVRSPTAVGASWPSWAARSATSTPAQRSRFLFDLDATMSTHDHLLLGTDLVKEPDRLVAAYDDSQGVTAEFNRNVLAVLNNELGADFDPSCFEHVAVWDEESAWIEMRLRARGAQRVRIDALGMDVCFEDGEELRTEISSKFRPDQVRDELWDAGFVVDASWTDPDGDFLLTLAHPYC